MAQVAIQELFQLEMWMNPPGFLKAARLPGANPVAVWRWELGEMGRDGPTTIPERVTVVSIPTIWHHHQGWDDNYNTQTVSAGHNAFGGTFADVRANACEDPVAVPESVRNASFPVSVETERLADGVFLLGGATHNSVAVEFDRFVVVVEAPLDERRSLAVIEEVVRLFPGKPIRYLVNTHQHFDHIGGLRTYLHIGATILTHWKNYDFYNRDVLDYTPRTVAPDMVSLWPPTELTEGYYLETVRENYVVTDGERILQLFYVHPLEHGEGMLVAYLPRERILVEADLFDTHLPEPWRATEASRSLRNVVDKLGLEVSQIVPIHGRPVSWEAFRGLE